MGSIEILVVTKLQKILASKNWQIDADDNSKIFTNFCHLLELLTNEEQNLVLNLVDKYEYFPFNTYDYMIKECVKEIKSYFSGKIDNFREIILLPIITERYFGYTKSGNLPLYQIKNYIPDIFGVATSKVFSYEIPSHVNEYNDKRNNALLIFVDDFLGSGDSAIEAIRYYEANLKKDDDTVILLSLVAQEQGVLNLFDNGYDVFSSKIRKKGLTDNYTLEEANAYKNIMRGIETKLKVSEKYMLGYKQSEALVSMIRTPNNTFPVFWYDKELSKTGKAAPFRR
jgi:hypothetical protein